MFQKTLALHDYYFGSPEYDYPLGTVQLTGKAPWQRLKTMAAGDLPQETEHMAAHSVDRWITTEDLPRPSNRVSLNGTGQIKVTFTPNTLKPHAELINLWTQQLRVLGFYLMTKTMPIETVWRQGGTAKFGVDPVKSVLDLNGKAHDLANLYVVDASFMPSLGATNPTLTSIANALRVGKHLGYERT